MKGGSQVAPTHIQPLQICSPLWTRHHLLIMIMIILVDARLVTSDDDKQQWGQWQREAQRSVRVQEVEQGVGLGLPHHSGVGLGLHGDALGPLPGRQLCVENEQNQMAAVGSRREQREPMQYSGRATSERPKMIQGIGRHILNSLQGEIGRRDSPDSASCGQPGWAGTCT